MIGSICFSIFFLMLLSLVSAKVGGSGIQLQLRISFWGTVAMAVTAAVGYLFGWPRRESGFTPIERPQPLIGAACITH
jgi:VIT1/CCC1 family predicted Fe2+/Mn2+ transporter